MDQSDFVFWTVRARRALVASLTMTQSSREEAGVQTRLERLLQRTFAGHRLVVHDRLTGFNAAKDQHILFVEVGERPENAAGGELGRQGLAGSYVVKIGPRGKLDRELAGWRECRPVGLNHDIVLLPQWQGHTEPDAQAGGDNAWTCIVYGDAHQLISVEHTLRFEEAVLNAVRHGLPTLDSVCGVLVQLYERVGHLLYRGAHLPGGRASQEDRPAGGAAYLDDIPRHDDRPNGKSKLAESIGEWNQAYMLRSLRTEIGLLIATCGESYRDPVTYIEQVRKAIDRHDRPPGEAGQVPLDAPVPGMLRGPAHGDLHGRNVLVGLVRDRVLFPALFDYEEMGRDNFIGWDFVKMEYELKMRAYAAILPRVEPVFAAEVHQHELMLAELTEDHHRDGSWDDTLCRTAQTPLARLAAVVTQIRHLASVHLGSNRSQRWLDEYYFLSALYGVHVGRFPNLQRRELAAALISAGVAASRTAWARQQYERERKLLGL